MQILNLEMGVFGGVITPVCSYIDFCAIAEYWGLTLPCIVLCVDLEPFLLSCPGSSVGRALCLESRVSWVESHPGQLLFPLKKGVVRVGVAFLLCTCLAPLESCVCDG